MKEIYEPDLINNSNDSLFIDVHKEQPDGTEALYFIGIVIRIHTKGVLLFVPHLHCNKAFCPKNNIGKRKLRVGEWYEFDAQRRRPRESDDVKPPLFSHFVLKIIRQVDIREHFNFFEQRFHGDLFEFLVVAKLTSGVPLTYIDNAELYVVNTEINGLQVLVPRKRLDDLLNGNINNHARTFKFWVTLAHRVRIPDYENEDIGLNLHLLDCSPIDEILPDGRIVSLGMSKTNLTNLNIKDCHKSQFVQAYNRTNSNPQISEAVDKAYEDYDTKPRNHSETETEKKIISFAAVTQSIACFSLPEIKAVIKSEGLEKDYDTVVRRFEPDF